MSWTEEGLSAGTGAEVGENLEDTPRYKELVDPPV